MINFLGIKTTLVASGIALVVGLYAGYKVTSNYYEAKANKAAQAVIEQLAVQAHIDRKTIEGYQVNEKTLQDAYKSLGEKYAKTKVTTAPCTLTASGARLWNESTFGKGDVSKDSSGVVGAGEPSSSKGQVDFAEAFQNKLINDEKCNKLREKLEAIKKWDKETFSD